MADAQKERVLTTYLSKIAANQGVNVTQIAMNNILLPKTALYVYDAFLTQCAFISRLTYASSAIFVDVFADYMEGSAANKNAGISQAEQNESLTKSFTTTTIDARDEICAQGVYIPAIGCNIIQYVNPNSKINNQRTLFVSFKGVSTLDQIKKVIQMSSTPLANINTTGIAVEGKCYSALLDLYEPYIKTIIDTVTKYAANVDQIVITGHSFGGSAATLFGLLIKKSLAAITELAQKSIHIVSFGALRILDKTAKVEFNKLLEFAQFTYDNIVNIEDIYVNKFEDLSFPGMENISPIGAIRDAYGKNFAGTIRVEDLNYNAPFNNVKVHPIMNDVYIENKKTKGGGEEGEEGEDINKVVNSNTIAYTAGSSSEAHLKYLDILFSGVWELPNLSDHKESVRYVLKNNVLSAVAEAAAAPTAAAAAPTAAPAAAAAAAAAAAPRTAGGGKTHKQKRFVRVRQLRGLTRALKAAARKPSLRLKST